MERSARLTRMKINCCVGSPRFAIRIPEGSYFSYIIASRSRTLYIEITSNLASKVIANR